MTTIRNCKLTGIFNFDLSLRVQLDVLLYITLPHSVSQISTPLPQLRWQLTLRNHRLPSGAAVLLLWNPSAHLLKYQSFPFSLYQFSSDYSLTFLCGQQLLDPVQGARQRSPMSRRQSLWQQPPVQRDYTATQIATWWCRSLRSGTTKGLLFSQPCPYCLLCNRHEATCATLMTIC